MPDDLIIVVGKRKIMWEPAVIEEPAPPTVIIDSQPDFTAESNVSTILVEGKRAYKKRTGNGHKSEKTRDLYDHEKDIIRDDLFFPKNGQINNDDCVAFRETRLKDLPAGTSSFKEVAIFQITGFVSVLHTRVAEGGILVNDLVAYEAWMRVKYGETLWARYNLPLYVKTRAINATLISQGQAPVKAQKVKKEKTPDPMIAEVVNTIGEVMAIQGISTTPKFTSFRKRFAGA
jgi:hypothetical protein